MSILGKYKKQGVEVEIYGIQFAEDMSTTDEINHAWQVIALKSAGIWNREVKSSVYTASSADADTILVTTTDVVLPSDASEGFRLSVANYSQTSAITVGAFSVPARGCVAVLMQEQAWVIEASTTSVLVSAAKDQRVRVTVVGGLTNQTYKSQVTVTTAEGRVMQDEFLVTIKEE